MLAAFLVAVPTVIAATHSPALAIGPDRLPVTITNNSGRGEAVYLYILGQDIRPGGRLGYVNAAGQFFNWPAGANPPSPAPDVSIPGPGNGGSVTVYFPRHISARMYFSLGRKLDFRLTPDGLVQPAPWAGNDPNRDILFDWSEFTYNDAGLWLNSSQVDMLAMPHAVSVTGADGRTMRTGDPVTNGRENIINQIRNTPDFARSVYTRSDGTVLRVLAPGKAMDAGLMNANYLDGYINSAWNAYTGRTLTVVPRVNEPDRRFFGRTVGNNMVFTDAAGAQVASVPKPTTANVWGCDGVFNAPNTPPFIEPEIKRTLCTALNRGTLGTSSQEPVLDANQFYRNSTPNHYSRIIHANMADGKAYGFAYDDVGGFESLVHHGDPRSAAVIISPFTGGSPPTGGGGTPTGRTIAGPGGKCVDVSGDDTGGDGAAVQLWDCQSGAKDQHWTWSGQTLQTLSKCLDITNGVNANGTPLQLATCNGGGFQNWVTQPDGSIRNPATGRCIDSPGGATGNGTRLQIYDCNGAGAQKFTIGTPIYGPGGKCVDVAGDDTGGDGAAVQLWDCQQATSSDQKWTWSGQTLRSLSKCLDITNGVNANGTPLQLATCNGGGFQNWVTQPDGSIRNPATGRCIDSPGGATGNGTRLQIYDCNGAGAQKFAMA